MGSLKLKLLGLVAALGMQLAASVLIAQTSDRIAASRADIDATARKSLRDVRIIVRDAKRLQVYQVVESANDLLGALRQFKLVLDRGANVHELQDLYPELSQLTHLLDLKVDQASRTGLTVLNSDYDIIKRDIRYLAVLLGLEEREDPSTPEEDLGIYIEANVGTAFKISTVQSAALPASQKCVVNAGDVLVISESSESLDGDHVKVKLLETIPGCEFGRAGRVGYVYGPHFHYVD